MKRIYLIGLVGLVVMILSCNSNSKKRLWNQEDHCDCMYKKTAKKYTPEEAYQLTVEQERKIWEACDYRW